MTCGNKICYCTGACRDSSRSWPVPVVIPATPVRRIKSIEYHPDGTTKKVEYFD